MCDELRRIGIWFLGSSRTTVAIPEWCPERVDPLLQPTIDSFLYLVFEVARVVRCDNGLDVGGQSTAAGSEIEILRGKAQIDTEINETRDIVPVPEVAGTTVDLMDYDPGNLPLSQEAQHTSEYRSATTRCALLFLEPTTDDEAVPFSVSDDGISLFMQGDSMLALLGRGNSNVGEIRFGNSQEIVFSSRLDLSLIVGSDALPVKAGARWSLSRSWMRQIRFT